jgi:hypothetical protein
MVIGKMKSLVSLKRLVLLVSAGIAGIGAANAQLTLPVQLDFVFNTGGAECAKCALYSLERTLE